MMTKEDKRYYFLFLSICLIASFIQNKTLWMLINPLFSLVSIYYYCKIRKTILTVKDSFFIASLCSAAIQEIFLAQRYNKSSLLFGVFFLFLMFFFFILSIQQEREYLLIGRKNMFTISIIIVVSAIICYICFFLPVIPDYLVFPVFVHVFCLFFSILIAVNRSANAESYYYVIGGMIMFVFTSLIAGVSLFITSFPLCYFLERLSFMLGICFLTQGLLKSYSGRRTKKIKSLTNMSAYIDIF